MRPLPLLAVIAACGGSTSTSSSSGPPPLLAGAPGAPFLLGRPVADGPLAAPAAQRALERATASLAEAPPTLAGDHKAVGNELRVWIERRTALLRDLNAALEQLPADQRTGLFASIVVGVAVDDLTSDLVGLSLPPSLATGPYAKDVEQAFREALEEQAKPLATRAREALARCAELAATAAPALRGWGDHCRARVDALRALEDRVASRPAPSPRPLPPPRMMKDCAGGEKSESEPDALPPDLRKPPKLVVRYEGSQLDGDDRARLVAAVTKKLRAEVKLPLVSAKDLAASEALVAKRKLTANGPVCGQAPRFTQVLGMQHRNLVIAQISTDCTIQLEPEKETCALRVRFKRAGTWDDKDLPKTYYAAVENGKVPASAWIAAVEKLSTDRDEADILGGILGGLRDDEPLHFRIKDYGDDDAWLRVSETLYLERTQQALAACTDAPASFTVKIAIGGVGATTAVELTPITAPPAGSMVAKCVRDALMATPWPCTRDGKPAEVDLKMCLAPKAPSGPGR